jgi:hypothetical protein
MFAFYFVSELLTCGGRKPAAVAAEFSVHFSRAGLRGISLSQASVFGGWKPPLLGLSEGLRGG